MKSKLNLILIILILISLSVGCDIGIWGEERVSISGKILDSNNRTIAEAEITTAPNTKTVLTNKYGYFNLDNVKKGDYQVIIGKEGYKTQATSCRVEGGLTFSCWGSSSNSYIEIHLILN